MVDSNLTTENKDVSVIYTQNNYLRGALGAFLGALVGAVPWAVVYSLGMFTAWLGLLIGIAAKKGYELFGGKKGGGQIAIICGAVVFAILLGNLLPDLFDFARLIYKGEIEGASYSDIPSLYISWVKFNDLFLPILKNLGLGLIFGLIGMGSLFRKMSAEMKPEVAANADATAGITAAQTGSSEKPEMDASLRNFTVFYAGRSLVILFCIITFVPLVLFVIAAIKSPENIAISLISLPIYLIIVGLPFFIHHRKTKKLKIEVNDDVLKITPAFGKEKTVTFKDITKVSTYPPLYESAYINVYYFIKVYSKHKRLFKIHNSYIGAGEMMRRLKAENIPFTASLSPF